jgi:hypothetical protein
MEREQPVQVKTAASCTLAVKASEHGQRASLIKSVSD